MVREGAFSGKLENLSRLTRILMTHREDDLQGVTFLVGPTFDGTLSWTHAENPGTLKL
jgi:hypothetical protein